MHVIDPLLSGEVLEVSDLIEGHHLSVFVKEIDHRILINDDQNVAERIVTNELHTGIAQPIHGGEKVNSKVSLVYRKHR